ncbi:MAG: polymer-forming cytoskeletal protein [Planctomycetota bacterium]
MAAIQQPREVRCYHCGRSIEVSAKAQSASCPSCHKSLNVADVVIKDTRRGVRVDSCGRVSIKARARVVTKTLHAMEGLEVLGKLQADVECRGKVVIGPKAEWKGDLRASALEVAKGAVIEQGYFDIGPFDDDADADGERGLARPSVDRGAGETRPSREAANRAKPEGQTEAKPPRTTKKAKKKGVSARPVSKKSPRKKKPPGADSPPSEPTPPPEGDTP